MRNRTALVVLVGWAVVLCAAGCGRNSDEGEPPQAREPEVTTPTAEPPTQTTPPVESDATAVEPEVAVDETAPAKTTYLGEALVSWNTGEKDKAAEQFVSLRWDDPVALQGIPALGMNEEHLVPLSDEQRTRILVTAQQLANSLEAMAQHVIAAGEALGKSGDSESARTYFEAVQQCGQALAAPGRLVFIQMVGETMAEQAEKKLSGTP